jgi:hypothetical protein
MCRAITSLADERAAQENAHGQRQLVMLIDGLSGPYRSPPRAGQRAKLRQLLMSLLTGLLEYGEDTELETLHDKYSDVSREDLRQSQLEMTQDMLQEVFCLDIGDDLQA